MHRPGPSLHAAPLNTIPISEETAPARRVAGNSRRAAEYLPHHPFLVQLVGSTAAPMGERAGASLPAVACLLSFEPFKQPPPLAIGLAPSGRLDLAPAFARPIGRIATLTHHPFEAPLRGHAQQR